MTESIWCIVKSDLPCPLNYIQGYAPVTSEGRRSVGGPVASGTRSLASVQQPKALLVAPTVHMQTWVAKSRPLLQVEQRLSATQGFAQWS